MFFVLLLSLLSRPLALNTTTNAKFLVFFVLLTFSSSLLPSTDILCLQVVIHSIHEHHSNLLPWRSVAEICYCVKEAEDGTIDLGECFGITEEQFFSIK